MKRTSVRYSVTSSYSHNTESERASSQIRRNAILVLTFGILAIAGIVVFIATNL